MKITRMLLAVYKRTLSPFIGNNCKIGKNVSLGNVILWDNVEIADNVSLKNVVCANNAVIKSSVSGADKWEIIGPDRVVEYCNL